MLYLASLKLMECMGVKNASYMAFKRSTLKRRMVSLEDLEV